LKKLIVILLIPTLALAWELPPGLELVSMDGDHVTVKDTKTGILDSYLIEGEPVINGWAVEPTEDSLIFELVANLYMNLTEDLQAFDFLNDGYMELVGCDLIIGAPLVFLENDGYFNFTEVNRIDSGNILYDLGDADDDGLIEVLTKWQRSMYIYEQTGLNTYADSLVWQITPLAGNYRVWPRYSDLDDDGLIEVSFQNSQGFRKVDIYENTGDNLYDNNFNIPWPNLGPGQFASGDFDGDGHTEIVGGSDYGILTVFESVASDSFEMIWQGDLGHPNAYMNRFIGDTDGDGFGEWVSGSHDFSHGGFYFKVFEAVGDNQYSPVYFDSLPGNPWFGGGVGEGDVDNDGINEFIFSSNFNVGLYKYYNNLGWDRVWHLDSLDGTVIPYLVDCDGDGDDEPVIATDRVPNYTRIYNLVTTDLTEVIPEQKDISIDIYPNPTNEKVILSYNLSKSTDVTLEIYDILGRKVETLIDEYLSPGSYAVTWNASHSASGIYFCRLRVGEYTTTRRMTILK
jgi:hypothetical protein